MSKSDDSNLAMYREGFKDGWEAAKKEFQKDNTYVPDTTKPARTMDLQWPRDHGSWGIIYTNSCRVCHISSNQLTNYVCNYPNCPSKVTS
jgi:hypothetical protein